MLKKTRALLHTILLSIAFLLLSVGLVELVCRSIRYDFSHQTALFEATPIYYRQPTVAVGPVFFQKNGPAEWKGNVLLQGIRMMGGLDDAYDNAPEVTVYYDRNGFRNPDTLDDWQIVVVGDSFVELGYLPYDDLFTTRMGITLGSNVKNLGLSHTGPLSYNYFLKTHGKSETTKLAVMVYFEGNDIPNLEQESQWLDDYKKTGIRPYRNIEKQTSFIRAVANLAGLVEKKATPHKRFFRNAYYTAKGKRIAVSVSYTPPSVSDLTVRQKTQLRNALTEWADISRELGMQPWLVYMPAKRRVLDGFLEFEENAAERLVKWQQTDLPAFIQETCHDTDIQFIDVTRGLKQQTENGILTYNSVWDTHLNQTGTKVVADIVSAEILSRAGSAIYRPVE